MNVPGAISLAAAVAGLGVAGLAFGVGRSPRWSRYRLLWLIALLAAVYCGLDVIATAELAPEVLLRITRLQSAIGAFDVVAWHFYADRHLRQTPSKVELLPRIAVAFVGAGWFLPGAFLDGSTTRYAVPALGATYQYANPTPLGIVAFVAEVGLLAFAFARYVRASRAGVDGALSHAAVLGIGLGAAAYDVVVTSGAIHGPFLLCLSLIIAVCTLAINVIRMFIADAQELDLLTRRLEHLVEERTNELVSTESALLRAEKLAALGQLGAGVAHEINNPAAAIAGNLEYLRDELQEQHVSAEALACIDESLEAVDRIATIVRQLLDVGRAAASASPAGDATSVGLLVQHAVATARATLSSPPAITTDVGKALFVRAEGASVMKVLVELIVNAGEMIGGAEGGHIVVRADAVGADIVISVTDNGPGMSEETKRRLFEPFYTTKPFGHGMGLGLSRCLGIVRSLGGDLIVDSRPRQTSMRLRLPAARPPASTPPAASGDEPLAGTGR